MQIPEDNGDWLERLLDDLGSEDEVSLYCAFMEAQALTPDRQLRLAKEEGKRYRRSVQRIGRLCSGSVLVGLLGSGLLMSLCSETFVILLLLSLIAALAGGLSWSGRSFLMRPFRLHRSVIRLMQNAKDARFVGPALTRLSSADHRHRPLLVAALKRLLPQLRPHHAQDWTKEQKAALLHILSVWDEDFELTLCALKALEAVGDKEAVEAIRPLADMFKPEDASRAAFRESETAVYFSEASLTTTAARQVQRAAAGCLAVLQERLATERHAQTLLRASDMTVPPETLLRPAAQGSDIPPEELLRPTRTGKA
jgi:hypothetical protein